jgi:hypothetical protein
VQLHQFELAVGMTNCTHEREGTYTIMSANGTNSSAGSNLTVGGNSTLNSTLGGNASTRNNSTSEEGEEDEEDEEIGFEIPEFEPGMHYPARWRTAHKRRSRHNSLP